jgi:hypothetical protein
MYPVQVDDTIEVIEEGAGNYIHRCALPRDLDEPERDMIVRCTVCYKKWKLVKAASRDRGMGGMSWQCIFDPDGLKWTIKGWRNSAVVCVVMLLLTRLGEMTIESFDPSPLWTTFCVFWGMISAGVSVGQTIRLNRGLDS